MKDSMVLTILAGVSVFVIGQFILKLVLEPIVEFKKVLGEISSLFLREQASIKNANPSEDTVAELKRLSSMLLAMKQAIPCYSFLRYIFGLPSVDNLILGSHSLNLISYHLIPGARNLEPSHKHAGTISKEMRSLGETLKIRVMYSEL